jgi:hypothetical protein
VTLSARERKMLLLLAPALLIGLILRLTLFSDAGSSTAVANTGNIPLAQQRVARLRQLKALVPGREAVMKQTSADVAARERGMIPGDTAAQAQAALLEAARRVGKSDQIDVRGAEFQAPKTLGDYGLVYAAITFECHVEQLVNFLADLGRQPELMVPSEERITAGLAKQKLIAVRIVLAGVVPKKLIPDKKALGAF